MQQHKQVQSAKIQGSGNTMDVDQFGPSGLMMAPSFSMSNCQGSNQMVGLSPENNQEMLRLIQQYLTHQGYSEIAN